MQLIKLVRNLLPKEVTTQFKILIDYLAVAVYIIVAIPLGYLCYGPLFSR